MNTPQTRRRFLQTTSFALAAAPAALRGGQSPNSTIGVGFIGCGDRGGFLMQELFGIAEKRNVRVTALCDVWRVNLDRSAERVAARQGSRPAVTTRFRELLARENVDAVVIATPDFSHGQILEAALDANKDVYIEKPMTTDLPSATRALIKARERKRVVQVGTQRRSDGHFRAAAEVVRGGALGGISRVTAEVNFNQARWLRSLDNCKAEDVDWDAFLMRLEKRPFDPALLRRWQLFRETSNGMPGLWMTHYADAVHMLTGARHPVSAVALGGIYVWNDGREHADTFHALLEYPEKFLFSWAMGLGNGAGTRFTLHGTRATLDAERWTVTPEPGPGGKAPEPSPIRPKGGVGHMQNWVDCLRSREDPNAPIETGHQHVVATAMAAMALQTGRRQVYDSSARKIRSV